MLTLKTTSLFSKTCSRCVSTSVVRSGVVSTSRRQNATPTSVQLNLLRAQPHSNRQHHHHTAAIAAAASAPGDQAAMAATTTAPVTPEQRQQIISDSIRGIPDFPKPGILFWDVTTLLLDPRAFQLTVDALYDRYKDQKIDAVAGGCVCVLQLRVCCVSSSILRTKGRGLSMHSQPCVQHSTSSNTPRGAHPPISPCEHTTCLVTSRTAAGFEARGLIFGAPLALALGCAFVPLRKPGKLPGVLRTALLQQLDGWPQ